MVYFNTGWTTGERPETLVGLDRLAVCDCDWLAWWGSWQTAFCCLITATTHLKSLACSSFSKRMGFSTKCVECRWKSLQLMAPSNAVCVIRRSINVVVNEQSAGYCSSSAVTLTFHSLQQCQNQNFMSPNDPNRHWMNYANTHTNCKYYACCNEILCNLDDETYWSWCCLLFENVTWFSAARVPAGFARRSWFDESRVKSIGQMQLFFA